MQNRALQHLGAALQLLDGNELARLVRVLDVAGPEDHRHAAQLEGEEDPSANRVRGQEDGDRSTSPGRYPKALLGGWEKARSASAPVRRRSCTAAAGGRVEREGVEHYSDSSSCGGPCAPGNGGGRGGSRPRFRSNSSAVRRLVTTATTLRFPPQGHCQTSIFQVRA